ncbi:MAG: ATP-binding cassette domain-containing protein, partial [Nanoarchaeota archaeon]
QEMLEDVGLGKRLRNKPSQLSGGEQQRVAIARALVNDPKIILADEPTGNLDSKTSIEIMNLLKSLNKKGKTIILITHNKALAKYASKTVNIVDGRIKK